MKNKYILLFCLICALCCQFYLLFSEVSSESDGYNAKLVRSEITLENCEPHEVYIIKTDSVIITDHCDDCRFCKTQNPEGNED